MNFFFGNVADLETTAPCRLQHAFALKSQKRLSDRGTADIDLTGDGFLNQTLTGHNLTRQDRREDLFINVIGQSGSFSVKSRKHRDNFRQCVSVFWITLD